MYTYEKKGNIVGIVQFMHGNAVQLLPCASIGVGSAGAHWRGRYCCPETEEFPDSGYAATSNPCTEQRYPAGPWQRKTVDPSVASEAAPPLANSEADSCPRNRGRFSSGAREDSRGSNCGQRGINPCSFLNHRQDAFGAERLARSFQIG